MRAFIVSALLSWVLSLPVLAQSWLDAPFDPDELTSDERRVLQAGLELAGTYYGVLDGIWDDSSTRALADFVADQGGSDAVTYRSLSPVLALLAAEVQSSGWQMQHFSDTDISVALPGRLVQQTGEDGTTWEADDGSVSFSVEYADRNDTRAQHKLIMARRATDVEPFVDETDEWLITSVTLRDGSNAYLRSDRVGDGYVTLFITAEQAQYPLLAFAASSMAAGDLPGFEVPEGGVLEVVQQSRPQAEPEPEPEPRAEPEPERRAEPKEPWVRPIAAAVG